jgi:hypothetical protein
MRDDDSLESLEADLAPAAAPALAAFLAGYLHEDWQLDHPSVAAAAWAFARDSEIEEVEELAANWHKVRALAHRQGLPGFNRWLAATFGTGWHATSQRELEAVAHELRRATEPVED